MNQPFSAVIGGANMDLSGIASAQARAGDSSPGKVTLSPGGVARNIAENLAHLGSQCELIAPLGNDLWGKQLIEHCQSIGIGTSHCLITDDQRSSTYLSLHDQHGELVAALNDMAIIDTLTPDALQQLLPVLQQAACWVLDANLSAETLTFLFAQAGDIPVWVDPVSVLKAQKFLPHLAEIYCMTPNLQEAALLADMPSDHHQDAPKLAERLHQQGVDKIMITLGAHGAYASDQQNAYWLPAQATVIKNVTGCGDAAIAALVHANNHGMDWYNSCKLAMSAAALTAASEQTNTPALQTLTGHL